MRLNGKYEIDWYSIVTLSMYLPQIMDNKCPDLEYRIEHFKKYKSGNVASVFYTNGDK